MPITLAVRTDDESALAELNFDAARIVIGRSSGSDVWLPDPSISHRHSVIRMQGSDYVVADEGSTNGTFVGGVRLEKGATRLLRTGDLLRVGRVWIDVRIGASPVALDAAMATRDVALALVCGAMERIGDDVIPRVHVVEGPDVGESIRLEEDGKPYTVGRADTCDLALADQDTSREHLSIIRRGLSVKLLDLGSKNGVFLGERVLPHQKETAWKSTSMVKLGRTVLALAEPLSLALAELESLPDELTPEASIEEPPPPPASSKASERQSEAPKSLSREALSAGTLGGSAPIAPAIPVQTTAKPKKSVTATDGVVIVASVAIIIISIAAFYWLLHGG
jgi:pSer/pThr/pTyr-binding forkhead associated (FHA) protein